MHPRRRRRRATAPLLYAPIDREVCVPTDGRRQALILASTLCARTCLTAAAVLRRDERCSGHEAGALAYAARRELERQGDAAEQALRGTIPGTRVRKGRPLDYC